MRKISYFEHLKLRLLRGKSKFRKKHPEIVQNYYPDDLIKIIERHVEVYGHAYCMDVPKERRKISKLVYELLNDLSVPNPS